ERQDADGSTADAERPTGKTGPNAGKNGSPGAGDAKSTHRPKGREGRGTLWVKDEEFVRPISVEVGMTDGTLTEVSGPDLTEGMDVVVGEIREDHSTSDTKNPFAPQFFRGGRSQGQGQGQGQGKGQRGG